MRGKPRVKGRCGTHAHGAQWNDRVGMLACHQKITTAKERIRRIALGATRQETAVAKQFFHAQSHAAQGAGKLRGQMQVLAMRGGTLVPGQPRAPDAERMHTAEHQKPARFGDPRRFAQQGPYLDACLQGMMHPDDGEGIVGKGQRFVAVGQQISTPVVIGQVQTHPLRHGVGTGWRISVGMPIQPQPEAPGTRRQAGAQGCSLGTHQRAEGRQCGRILLGYGHGLPREWGPS